MKKNLDIMKPLYREQTLPVSWPFVILRQALVTILIHILPKVRGKTISIAFGCYQVWKLKHVLVIFQIFFYLNFLKFLLSQIVDIMGLRQGKIQTRPARKISDGIKI